MMKMRDDIIERVLSVEKTVIKTYTLATCMSIISAMVEQYEEDKNQTWNEKKETGQWLR